MRLLGEDGVELRAESTRTMNYISEKVNERYTMALVENIFSVLLFLQSKLSIIKKAYPATATPSPHTLFTWILAYYELTTA
jgi:hypothetical protein